MLGRVLEEIKPTEEEHRAIVANANKVMARLKGIVSSDVELHIVGSVARGTNLKGDSDIDIFMLFPSGSNKEEILKKGLGYGKELARTERRGRYEIKYAEHPYVKVYLDSIGIRADIVPAFKIKNAGELATAVDRTPLHTEFIEASLNPKQKDDVRLLKYLLKAHHIYGAETKTGGFSGYLCELLILHYGSFTKAMSGFSGLKLPVVIDPRRKSEYIDIGVNKRFGSDFVVIDPVDAGRNVSAAVSHESLARLVLVSRAFTENPNITLFYGIKFSSARAGTLFRSLLKDSGLESLLIVSRVPDKSPDAIWPQLNRVLGRIVGDVEHEGFRVYESVAWTEGTRGFILVLSQKDRIVSKLLRGPDVFETSSSTSFIKAHRAAIGYSIKGRRIYALEHAPRRRAEEVIKGLMGKRGIRHKDIDLRKARLFTNSIPREYAESAYFEIMKRLVI